MFLIPNRIGRAYHLGKLVVGYVRPLTQFSGTRRKKLQNVTIEWQSGFLHLNQSRQTNDIGECSLEVTADWSMVTFGFNTSSGIGLYHR